MRRLQGAVSERPLLFAVAVWAVLPRSGVADDRAVVRPPPRVRPVGVDTPADPSAVPPSAADSPAPSSGPFDAVRPDLGGDTDLQQRQRGRSRKNAGSSGRIAEQLPDPLAGTPTVSPDLTGQDADQILAALLPPRSDSPADWTAPIEPLHRCGEPRALPPCVPPPPCHPSLPPAPYDLVGVAGDPSCGPIYQGPCGPRTGTHDDGPHPHLHRVWDRLFDAFYRWK